MPPQTRKKKKEKRKGSHTTEESIGTIRMPITDQLDLHAFSPAELDCLLEDYLEECVKEGIGQVRIIHGKGMGVQRRRVQAFLSRSLLVESYHDADLGGGGWGATVAVLKKGDHPTS